MGGSPPIMWACLWGEREGTPIMWARSPPVPSGVWGKKKTILQKKGLLFFPQTPEWGKKKDIWGKKKSFLGKEKKLSGERKTAFWGKKKGKGTSPIMWVYLWVVYLPIMWAYLWDGGSHSVGIPMVVGGYPPHTVGIPMGWWHHPPT